MWWYVLLRHYDRITNMPFYQQHCFYLLPMMGWFIFSAALSAYNKFVFGQHGTVAFPCALLLTSVHFACQWGVSTALCAIMPEITGLARIQQMTWQEFLSVSVPCGLVTAADVGLSNLSLQSISLTFYTMVKASAPIFVLFWAWCLRIERVTWPLLAVIAVIVAGEFLTVAGEADFVPLGFFQCLAASFFSGARWTLVQLKLTTLEPPLKTSLATMRVLAPSMFVGLLATALAIERPWKHLQFHDTSYVIGLGAIGGILAIAMTLCEFMLIMQASAIVLMIGGVVKELLNIFIGVACFGDELNAINIVGFIIVFAGVVLYKFTFHGPSSSTIATTSTEPPVPVVEHYGRVASHDDSSSPTRNNGDGLMIHSKTSDEDWTPDDERYKQISGGTQSDQEKQQQQQPATPMHDDIIRRRSDNLSSDDDASDQVELRESKGTFT